LVHWSATLVAPVTLNCLLAPVVAELEFIPEFVPAELLLGADALALAVPDALALAPAALEAVLTAPSCPVT
jgi:hypothetical protein